MCSRPASLEWGSGRRHDRALWTGSGTRRFTTSSRACRTALLTECVEAAVATGGRPAAVLFLDLDDFRRSTTPWGTQSATSYWSRSRDGPELRPARRHCRPARRRRVRRAPGGDRRARNRGRRRFVDRGAEGRIVSAEEVPPRPASGAAVRWSPESFEGGQVPLFLEPALTRSGGRLRRLAGPAWPCSLRDLRDDPVGRELPVAELRPLVLSDRADDRPEPVEDAPALRVPKPGGRSDVEEGLDPRRALLGVLTAGPARP